MSVTGTTAVTPVAEDDDDSEYHTTHTDKAGLRGGILAARDIVRQATAGRDVTALENNIIAGEWTARDIVGHLANWDERTRRGIGHALAGTDPSELKLDDFDGVNGALVAARRARGDDWTTVNADLDAAVEQTLALLESISEEQLMLPASLPWGRMSTLLDAFGVFEFHVEEHHADLLATGR